MIERAVAWAATGLLVAGLSIAALAGAGLAAADDDASTKSDTRSTAESKSTDNRADSGDPADEPAPLSSYGNASAALVAARPGQFTGVQLMGGTHSDAWRIGNPVAQFLVGLVTGQSTPRNVEAVQVLAKGWIDDWYAGTHTDEFYGTPGSTMQIATDAGTAEAYVLPAPPPRLTFVDLIIRALLESTANLQFANCASDPSADSAAKTRFDSENSTPDTALSLDGKASAGQSVGQHVCMG